MSNTLSYEAILLHARALERDTPENAVLGRVWLETLLGAAVRATASKAGWDLVDVSDAELGGAIWRTRM